HVDVLPILIAGVLDQRPALQQWSAVLAALAIDHQAIAGLPHRILDDIADLDRAFPLPLEVEADDLLLAVVRGGEDFEGAAQLAAGWVRGEIEGEALERLLDRFLAVVADDADATVVGVLQDHALEQVIDVGDAEGHVNAAVAVDGALALEIANAGVKEDDMAE